MKKLCINCMYRRGSDVDLLKCSAPQGIDPAELLVGNMQALAKIQYCANQRSVPWPFAYFLSACGKSGRWFKGKET